MSKAIKSVTGGLFGGASAASGAAGAQSEAIQKAMEEIKKEFGVTEEQFAPFLQAATGGEGVTGALTRQQEFLGLRGPEAQQAAFTGFMESPGQAFLRQRGEQSLLRNASAMGGLGGGNIRQALQEQGIGFAAQQQSELQDRLAGMTGLGFQATQGLGGLRSQKAANIGQMLTGQGQARASGILGEQQGKASTASNLLNIAGTAASFFPSDERVKTDIHDLDLEDCYKAVMTLPLKSWRYLESMGLGTDTHFGPMAQEAPDCIRAGEIDGIEALDLHNELMLIAGCLQYMKQEGMLRIETCH
jgi:hypothetical protein